MGSWREGEVGEDGGVSGKHVEIMSEAPLEFEFLDFDLEARKSDNRCNKHDSIE